jgi:hypothetical protein
VHYWSLIYFVNHTLHVPGMFIVHPQEVFTLNSASGWLSLKRISRCTVSKT